MAVINLTADGINLFIRLISKLEAQLVIDEKDLDEEKINDFIPVLKIILKKTSNQEVKDLTVNYFINQNAILIIGSELGFASLISDLEFLLQYIQTKNLPEDIILGINDWGFSGMQEYEIEGSVIVRMLRINALPS